MPARMPVRRPDSRVASTTTPATMMPTAIALGNRTENGEVPKAITQKCRKR
jgi:hypothetical protein